MPIIQLSVYFALAVMIFGTAYKAIKIARMPMHLRWDLYPIPHEKGKEHYGGSYYEETDWWTKPRKSSLISEIKEMAREILAIQTLYRNNRALWLVSFPFHLGLYFLTAFLGFLLVGAIIQNSGIMLSPLSPNQFAQIIFYATIISGGLGLILGQIGTVGLLLFRAMRPSLRRYSTIADYFNLILLLLLFNRAFVAWQFADRSFGFLRTFISQLITFKAATPIPAQITIALAIASIFFLYLPFTHMTHFVGKYFAFHKVRWQDDPNFRNGRMEELITASLDNIQDWSANHIKSGKSWTDAASDDGRDSGVDQQNG